VANKNFGLAKALHLNADSALILTCLKAEVKPDIGQKKKIFT
jgi:hypothetical protein